MPLGPSGPASDSLWLGWGSLAKATALAPNSGTLGLETRMQRLPSSYLPVPIYQVPTAWPGMVPLGTFGSQRMFLLISSTGPTQAQEGAGAPESV